MESIKEMTCEEALLYLAKKGFAYKEISSLLLKIHNQQLSPNAIGKRLKRMGLPSRKGIVTCSEKELKNVMQEVLCVVPETVGYRNMTGILRQKGICVRRDTVMQLMRVVDPDGVRTRRRRRIIRRSYRSLGPNFMWHMDGYDKLKPFGLAIHGCIDGYSRKILWLDVGASNNDPKIVASYYINCVKTMKGCPLVLRADPGTENITIGAMQCLFRHGHYDDFSGINSFHVARSVFNQRIEAWWSMLRRRQSHWWIDFFKNMESAEMIHRGNTTEIRCMRYCFIPLVQHELDCVVEEWNCHVVSFSRQAGCPNGRPDVMYSLCENWGGTDCLQYVSENDVEWAFTMCTIPNRSGSDQFDNFARNVFEQNGHSDSFTWQGAMDNYIMLLSTCIERNM